MNKVVYQKIMAVNRIMSVIRHDMSNMLNGITGFAEVISIKSGNSNGVSGNCDRIISGCKDINRLMTDYSKYPQADHLEVELIDINDSVDRAAGLIGFSMGPNIKVVTKLQADRPNVRGGAADIQGIFLELGKNARAAMGDEGEFRLSVSNVTLDEVYCREAVVDLEPGEYVKITAADTGQGADEDAVLQFFDPYYTTSGEKRRGLGLPRTLYQILRMKGDMDVQSIPGQGTVFTILLPAASGH